MEQPSPTLLDTLAPIAILGGAVFVHACFQLSLSVLTLLSSHTIGRRLSNTHLLRLNAWYIVGAIATISLLQLAATALLAWKDSFGASYGAIAALTIAPVVALCVVFFYYRRGSGRGKELWLPRPVTEYVTDRAKRTKSGSEAFALGATTAFAELPFALAPMLLVALWFAGISSNYWFGLSFLYALAVCLPLVFVTLYLSSGHRVSSVQRWRKDSRTFLQWTSAVALMAITALIAVMTIGAGQ